ncbi:6-phosphofructo-2-kinase-domain-containing protein [Jimgerdemannia flammicorona]|uniref:6-phosphofructo-2-kinase-domain-containing protein n=1 Tax=Jimgerdemannia flammicorona TaxID=994334 RepID=A0A433D2K4_9FUNG|nr:6-phosphofructo-2-kinase-domain-containing protein [Jimgerdemannia flammicorona]
MDHISSILQVRLFHAQTKGVQRGNYRRWNTATCTRPPSVRRLPRSACATWTDSRTAAARLASTTQAIPLKSNQYVTRAKLLRSTYGVSRCRRRTIDPEEAVKDFKDCIDAHEPYYETITDLKLSFVKMVNVGEQIVVNNVNEYLQSRIVYYLMNLHINPCTIYFAQNGEFLNQRLYMADADLSEEGHRYAENLKNFLLSYREKKQAANSEEKPRQLTVGLGHLDSEVVILRGQHD